MIHISCILTYLDLANDCLKADYTQNGVWTVVLNSLLLTREMRISRLCIYLELHSNRTERQEIICVKQSLNSELALSVSLGAFLKWTAEM